MNILPMCCPIEESEKEHSVAAQTIERLEDLTKIEKISAGAAYSQLTHMLFSKHIPLKKVKSTYNFAGLMAGYRTGYQDAMAETMHKRLNCMLESHADGSVQMIPLMSEEFEEDHPVTAQTIKCFAIVLGASINVLVFFVAPIVTIILVSVGKISPWWLFLGCGLPALGLCLSCCLICSWCIISCFIAQAGLDSGD